MDDRRLAVLAAVWPRSRWRLWPGRDLCAVASAARSRVGDRRTRLGDGQRVAHAPILPRQPGHGGRGLSRLCSGRSRLTQQHGYAHAGAITSVVDSACGYAALTKAPADHEVVTVEFKVNFVRPAVGEKFLAVGRVLTSGRLITVCTGEVRANPESQPKVVAIMQATVMNVPRDA